MSACNLRAHHLNQPATCLGKRAFAFPRGNDERRHPRLRRLRPPMQRTSISFEVRALAWLLSFGAALGSLAGIWTSRIPSQKISGKGILPDKAHAHDMG